MISTTVAIPVCCACVRVCISCVLCVSECVCRFEGWMWLVVDMGGRNNTPPTPRGSRPQSITRHPTAPQNNRPTTTCPRDNHAEATPPWLEEAHRGRKDSKPPGLSQATNPSASSTHGQRAPTTKAPLRPLVGAHRRDFIHPQQASKNTLN